MEISSDKRLMGFAGRGRCSWFFAATVFFYSFVRNCSHGSLTSFFSEWNLSVPLFRNFCRERSLLQTWWFGSYFQLYSFIKVHLLLKASFGGMSNFICCSGLFLACSAAFSFSSTNYNQTQKHFRLPFFSCAKRSMRLTHSSAWSLISSDQKFIGILTSGLSLLWTQAVSWVSFLPYSGRWKDFSVMLAHHSHS